MLLKASEWNSKSGKGSKRTSRCFLTLILNCFTQPIRVGFCLNMLVCHLRLFPRSSLPRLCTYVWGGDIKIRARTCACLFWCFQISISFGEKSLSAPLISILTQYSVWHKVDEQLYLKVKHLKNVFCTVYVESGDVGLTSKFMEMGGRAHFFLSLVGSSSISALIWDSFIPAMRLILSRQTGGGVTWTYKHTHTPNPETCQDAGDTYFHTMAFSLALYFAFPFIQITCTPLVFRGVGIRTCSKHS